MALALSPTTLARFEHVGRDLRRVFGTRFVALVVYGPHRSAAFVASIEPADLDATAALTEAWHRDHIATPLVMTPDELRRSLEAFPLEFQAMIDRHVLIDGTDPFGSVRISPADLRRACEIQAKGHLVHLRQGWLETHGHADQLGELAARSAGPFRALLAQVAQLSGEPAESTDALIAFAERAIQLPADIGRDLLAVDEHPEAAKRLASRLPEYLLATEKLWTFVDGWAPR